MPMGKRVCESPPVPTVSGRRSRFSHEWMTPSPGRSETPPRCCTNSGSALCIFTSAGLRVGRRVAERLHEHRRLELEAGELLQLVGGHRAGGVLRADGRHPRLVVAAGEDAGDAAGLADHLLRERVALARLRLRVPGLREEVDRAEAERLARPVGEGAPDDERDAAAGAELVGDGVGRELERREHLARLAADLALLVSTTTTSPVFSFDDVGADRERARVLRRVEEDRRDHAADDDAAAPLVRDERDVLADVPRARCCRRSCGTTRCRPRRRRRRPGSPARGTRRSWRGPPGTRVLPIASAWSGMSGRVDASPAGEKSSVLISPSTLKTFTFTGAGTPGAR